MFLLIARKDNYILVDVDSVVHYQIFERELKK